MLPASNRKYLLVNGGQLAGLGVLVLAWIAQVVDPLVFAQGDWENGARIAADCRRAIGASQKHQEYGEHCVLNAKGINAMRRKSAWY